MDGVIVEKSTRNERTFNCDGASELTGPLTHDMNAVEEDPVRCMQSGVENIRNGKLHGG